MGVLAASQRGRGVPHPGGSVGRQCGQTVDKAGRYLGRLHSLPQSAAPTHLVMSVPGAQ